MEEVDDDSIDTIITSCPYWGLRDYGKEANQIWGGDPECKHQWGNKLVIRERGSVMGPTAQVGNQQNPKIAKTHSKRGQFCQKCGAWYGQLGLEPTLNMYIDHLLIITAECKRVLKPTGVLWWNHGDCYGGSQGRGKGKGNEYGQMKSQKTIGAKCLALQNFRLIIRLIDEQGWILRNAVEWNKPNGMPSSTKDRLTNKYEPVFFLVKNTKTQYYWNDKTGLMADRKPKELKEGIDWDWVEIGENYSDSDTKIPKEEAQKLNSPRARVYRGKKRKKKTYWHSLDYWFDLDSIRDRWTDKRESDIKRAREKHPGYLGKYGLGYNAERRDILPGQGIKGQPVGNPDSGKNPGDVWTIPTQPYPEAHFACVDSKTKILTIDGWKNYKEIKWQSRIKIATYNLRKKVIEYQPIDYLKEYDFQGELIKVGNRDLDILTTPNHRSLVVKRSGKEEIVLAESLAYSDKIKVLAPVKYKIEYSIGKKWAELVGWVISEGHYKKGDYVEIYQNIGEDEKRIDYLLKEIPHSKNIRTRKYNGNDKEQVIWFIKKCSFVSWIYEFVSKKEVNKLLVSLPKDELKVLFKSLVAGDGNIRQDGRMQFIQKSKECVDWFEILAMRLGYHTLTTKRKDGNCYAVFLTKKEVIGIRGTNGKGKSIQKVKYNGKVWCPKTPNGTWIAKRNGKIFITGNTFPEKLVIRPILSSCPEWICKKCGKPRVRITKKDNPDHTGKTGSEYKTGQNANRLALLRQAARERGEEFVNKITTTGWTDCGCNAGWRPGITLDLFAGSGTTLAVAKKNGRQFIGYEIAKSYIPLIRKRLAKEDTMFNRDLKEQFL